MKERNIKVIKVTGILFFIVLFAVTTLLLIGEFGAGPSLSNLYRDGKQINGVFTNYENQIYATVPSSGYYLMKEADVNSFREIDNQISNRQFAVDKNHAYCGNRIVAGFNPNTAKALGDGYFSDGKTTCYCAPMSVPNENLSGVSYVLQRILYGAGLVDKPQSDVYPIHILEDGQSAYSPILRTNTATNGKRVYYHGKILPKANPQTLRQIPVLFNDGDTRDSYVYLADDNHVYYKNEVLPLQPNGELHAITFDAQTRENYLIDPKDGMVYVNNIPFDKKYAPYQELSMHGEHAYHGLFLSSHGMFYYDVVAKEVKQVDTNPFLGANFKEIEPLIFSDGKRILYVQTSERWGGRRSPGLISRTTHIYELDEPVNPEAWQKVGMVNHNFGAIWKNGADYFYFDQLGNGQGIKGTIYRIANEATVRTLIEKDVRIDAVRELIRGEDMTIAKNKEVINVTTKYRDGDSWFIWIIIALGVGVRVVLWGIRKMRVNPKPFEIDNMRLKINNLWSKRYRLSDIYEVTFFVERAARQSGYNGRFQVILKNGEHSRKYMFASQMGLKGDTKDELELYIADLQHTLTSYKIKSQVVY
ncbi:MAG: DKNYY domain-containing protein [Sphingobacterium sp.]|jgi:hypothetical protein|nr:DKNYY domain-containing protein [Sphingobacterium sp.]